MNDKTIKNGRYTLLRTLGSGSQGETWEARDEGALARPDPKRLASDFEAYVKRAKRDAPDNPSPRGLVAVKRFRVGTAKSWKDVELAEREATTLATLSHPNLPVYLDHFEEDGALYLVMEKIEGESLVPGETKGVDVVRMLEDLGDALQYLHSRTPPIVHRDVKPANVIRRPDGSYALVDFGAVRHRLEASGGSTVVGTFGYMAPEQFQGRASTQSDLYGLAATALAMMTGRQPEDLPHTGLGIDVEASLPRGTPRALVKTLAAMLTPDPDARVGSIEEALTMLRAEQPREAPSERAKARRPREPERPRDPEPERGRRRERRRERRARRDDVRRARRAGRRGPPMFARVFAMMGLFVAALVVGVVVGLIVPTVLYLLSIVFGARLRVAAENVRAAQKRADAAIVRAIGRVRGTSPELEGVVEVRVAGEGSPDEEQADRVRVADGPPAERGARVHVDRARDIADGEDDDLDDDEKDREARV
ncbi:MAG: serine/threonine-protein kinase [Polyangiaceae bacterium]